MIKPRDFAKETSVDDTVSRANRRFVRSYFLHSE
jgi:hypothetical protein